MTDVFTLISELARASGEFPRSCYRGSILNVYTRIGAAPDLLQEAEEGWGCRGRESCLSCPCGVELLQSGLPPRWGVPQHLLEASLAAMQVGRRGEPRPLPVDLCSRGRFLRDEGVEIVKCDDLNSCMACEYGREIWRDALFSLVEEGERSPFWERSRLESGLLL